MNKQLLGEKYVISVPLGKEFLLFSKKYREMKLIKTINEEAVLEMAKFFKAYEDAAMVPEENFLDFKKFSRLVNETPINVVICEHSSAPLLFTGVTVAHARCLMKGMSPSTVFYVFEDAGVLTREALITGSVSKLTHKKLMHLIGEEAWAICKKYMALFDWKYELLNDGVLQIHTQDPDGPWEYAEPKECLSYFIDELGVRIADNCEDEDIREYVLEQKLLMKKANELGCSEVYPTEKVFEKEFGSQVWAICKKYLKTFEWEYLLRNSKDFFLTVHQYDNQFKTFDTPKEFLIEILEKVEFKMEAEETMMGQEVYTQEMLLLSDALSKYIFIEKLGTAASELIRQFLAEKRCLSLIQDDGSVVLIDTVYKLRTHMTFSIFLGWIKTLSPKEVSHIFEYLSCHYQGMEKYESMMPNVSQEVVSIVDKILRAINCYIEVNEMGMLVKLDFLREMPSEIFVNAVEFTQWVMSYIEETKACHSEDSEVVKECDADLEVLIGFVGKADTKEIRTEVKDIQECFLEFNKDYKIEHNLSKYAASVEDRAQKILKHKSSENLSSVHAETNSIEDDSDHKEVSNIVEKGLEKVCFANLLRNKEVGKVLDNRIPSAVKVIIDDFSQLYMMSTVVDDVFVSYSPTTLLEVVAITYKSMEDLKMSILVTENTQLLDEISREIELLKTYFSL